MIRYQALGNVKPHYSKSGPLSSGIHITWQLGRNVESEVWSRDLGLGNWNLHLTRPQVIHEHTEVWGAQECNFLYSFLAELSSIASPQLPSGGNDNYFTCIIFTQDSDFKFKTVFLGTNIRLIQVPPQLNGTVNQGSSAILKSHICFLLLRKNDPETQWLKRTITF